MYIIIQQPYFFFYNLAATGKSASKFLFLVVIVVTIIIYSKYKNIYVNLELFIYFLSNYRLLRNVKLKHLLYYVHTA